ncbi:MAG TPA: hypothetical protein VGH87_18835 [Polyangiaceae bacterium]
MMRTNLPLSLAVTVVFLLSALAPGSFARDILELDALVFWAYCFARPKESHAVLLSGLACVMIVQARALTGVYFVTPLAMFHTGRAMMIR